MNVASLRKRLKDVPDGLDIIIEAEKGQKHLALTAKKRAVRVGRSSGEVFWIATGKKVQWRDVG